MIERADTGALLACYRIMHVNADQLHERSYCGESYGLEKIAARFPKMLELGRFCTASEESYFEVIRLAWAELVQVSIESEAEILFGCSSFSGVDPANHAESFAYLCDNCLAPDLLQPVPRAREPVDIRAFGKVAFDKTAAQMKLPPLLRFYLSLGAFVSDHGSIDHDLGTIHVLTLLPIENIPAAKKRSLLNLTAD